MRFARTGDPSFPWAARAGETIHLLRVNDFPAEPLYSHFEDGVFVRDLDSTPAGWTLDCRAPAILGPDLAAALLRARTAAEPR